MRLFLAIDIPDEIKNKIDKKIIFLKERYPDFTWVPKENYHITLFFFGETEKIDLIKRKIEDLVYDQESFYLHTFGADLFINKKIIIYLNFYREKRIEKLAEKIHKTFYFFDLQKPKNKKIFVPHLTLARARIPSKQQYLHLKKSLHKIKIESSFFIEGINLYQSIIGGKKPFYKKIATFPLK